MANFNWSNEKTFNQNSRNKERLSDSVAVVEYPAKGYGAYRFVGNPVGTALHWVTTLAKPKEGEKAGKKPRIVSFPKVCLGFDPETAEVDSSKCPYCEFGNPRIEMRQNVIDRKVQDNEPRKSPSATKKERKLVEWNGGKHYLKESKDTGAWTPVRVLPVIPAIGNGIVEITSLNKHTVKGEKKTFGPDHKKYGFDVMVKYDKDASSPAKMYLVQKGEIQPLTEEEMAYPIWDIPPHKPEDEATAKKEAKRMRPYVCNREGELLYPDAEKGEKSAKKNKYKDQFDEDEDLENDEDEDEDEDDDDRPSKSKKSKSKSKSKSSKNWDDEDEDDDDDDDDEAPFDTDDDDDDEDEDERPKKSKSKSKSGKTSKVKTKVGKSKLKLKK